jgi:hypothetical protein
MVDGRIQGVGRYEAHAGGGLMQQGHFFQGFLHGPGVEEVGENRDRVSMGEWRLGELHRFGARLDGSVGSYKGQFTDGVPEGYGVSMVKTADQEGSAAVYRGSFANGLREGRGVMEFGNMRAVHEYRAAVAGDEVVAGQPSASSLGDAAVTGNLASQLDAFDVALNTTPDAPADNRAELEAAIRAEEELALQALEQEAGPVNEAAARAVLENARQAAAQDVMIPKTDAARWKAALGNANLAVEHIDRSMEVGFRVSEHDEVDRVALPEVVPLHYAAGRWRGGETHGRGIVTSTYGHGEPQKHNHRSTTRALNVKYMHIYKLQDREDQVDQRQWDARKKTLKRTIRRRIREEHDRVAVFKYFSGLAKAQHKLATQANAIAQLAERSNFDPEMVAEARRETMRARLFGDDVPDGDEMDEDVGDAEGPGAGRQRRAFDDENITAGDEEYE